MTQRQHDATTDEVVDAMNRTLRAEEAARERVAAAQAQAQEHLAAAREARHRILERAQGRITRVRLAVADRLEAELKQMADQSAKDGLAGGFSDSEVHALQRAVQRVALRLIGGEGGT